MTATKSFSVRHFLRNKEAVLVHFNTPMSNHPTAFPQDLVDARGLVGTELAFSTILKTDKGPKQVQNPSDANAVGSVGLIVDIQDAGSVISVGSSDIGSNSRVGGVATIRLGRPPSAQTCADSIDGRAQTSNNEWVVKDFAVLGMFVFLPAMVFVRDPTDSMNTGERTCSLPEILAVYPDDRIYSVFNGQFVEYNRANGQWLPTSYDAIVPP